MRNKFIILFLISGLSVRAQLPEYYVDLYLGDVQIIKPGKKPVQVKKRMLIFPEDILLLKKDGQRVTLVNKEKQYIILTAKGNYKISNLSKLPHEKTFGITEKFLNLIWEELLDPGSFSRDANLKTIAGSWGGVNRGSCDFIGVPADNFATEEPAIEFSWRVMDSTKHYRFTLFDRNSNIKLRLIIRDTLISLSNANFLPLPENRYYWQVESVENKCGNTPRYLLNWLNAQTYMLKTNELIQSVKKDENAHYYLEVCKVLYAKGFYKMAAEYFLKALDEQ